MPHRAIRLFFERDPSALFLASATIPAWHIYAVLIDFDAAETTRGQLMRTLEKQGIRTQVHYIPVPRHPYYRRRYGEAVLPGAEVYYRRTLSLPLYVGMSDADVGRVATALEQALGRGSEQLRRRAS